jgi:hypothetical protein
VPYDYFEAIAMMGRSNNRRFGVYVFPEVERGGTGESFANGRRAIRRA